VTPGSVKIRSSTERDAIGNNCVSREVSVAPTTVRFVSITGGSAVVTTTGSATTVAGGNVKSKARLCPETVGMFEIS
jgi:hypothetical protein